MEEQSKLVYYRLEFDIRNSRQKSSLENVEGYIKQAVADEIVLDRSLNSKNVTEIQTDFSVLYNRKKINERNWYGRAAKVQLELLVEGSNEHLNAIKKIFGTSDFSVRESRQVSNAVLTFSTGIHWIDGNNYTDDKENLENMSKRLGTQIDVKFNQNDSKIKGEITGTAKIVINNLYYLLDKENNLVKKVANYKLIFI